MVVDGPRIVEGYKDIKGYVLLFIAALKIHCSSQCQKYLDELGGYILEERGLVSMKVKFVEGVILSSDVICFRVFHLVIFYSYCLTKYII